jgi:thioredoxin-related protein
MLIAIGLLAFFTFLSEQTINEKLDILDNRTTRINEDIKSLNENQKRLLLIINTLRSRINNIKSNGKTEEKSKTIEYRIRDIEQRESELNEE